MHKKTTRAGRAAVARAKYAASKRSRKHPVRTVERPVRRTGVGSAGNLIPPTDVHVLANALPEGTSVTLHVYGGSLDRCRIFVPRAEGVYEEQFRALSYDDY